MLKKQEGTKTKEAEAMGKKLLEMETQVKNMDWANKIKRKGPGAGKKKGKTGGKKPRVRGKGGHIRPCGKPRKDRIIHEDEEEDEDDEAYQPNAEEDGENGDEEEENGNEEEENDETPQSEDQKDDKDDEEGEAENVEESEDVVTPTKKRSRGGKEKVSSLRRCCRTRERTHQSVPL